MNTKQVNQTENTYITDELIESYMKYPTFIYQNGEVKKDKVTYFIKD